jgi:hypothetical protein
LSYTQERLWFLDQLGLVGAAYNIPAVVRLEGVLDVTALERSLGEVIRRHEVLRTRFETEDGRGIQVIEAAGRIPAWSGRHEALSRQPSGKAAMDRIAAEERDRRFELSARSSVPCAACAAQRRGHVLVTMHHIVSGRLVARRFDPGGGEALRGVRSGRPSPLPALAIQ